MCDALPTPSSAQQPSSKQSHRRQVWEHLEKSKLVNFPRPVFGRIPNFKGADLAAAHLLALPEFLAAKTVEVNPDKPLEAARALVVSSDKILYVPAPRLPGFLKRISFCREDKPQNVRQAVTRWGMEALGKDVGAAERAHVDVLVVGSVAVSRDGRRIGKGKGYADLEYAILREMGVVDAGTVVVTVVHESQVFERLPEGMFGRHDVGLDYILTPEGVITVEGRGERPEGLFWEMLSKRRVDLVPVLQKMKDERASAGREITLKEDTDDEQEEKRRSLKPKRTSRSRSKSRRYSETTAINNNNNRSSERPHKKNYFRRSVSEKLRKEMLEEQGDKENVDGLKKKTGRPFRKNPRKLQVDFSLMVSNIDKNVRVRHLKDALIDRGIKPSNITWRGYKGFCYLHYAKPVKKEQVDASVGEEKPFIVDNVIEILQTLKLNDEGSDGLSVKVMEPIARIETSDVTAV